MSDARASEEGLDLADAIREAIRSRMIETHTALPGIVQAFYPADQTADVRIPMKRVFTDLDGVVTLGDWPLLAKLPVVMPHAGGFHISFPVAAGDECLVIFLERDPGRWLEGSEELPPETNRTHDISDGVALVGLNAKANRIPGYNADDLEISADGGSQGVTLRANGDVSIESSKLALGAGVEEVLAILGEICDLIAAMTVSTGTGLAIPPTTTNAAALKARILAVKA